MLLELILQYLRATTRPVKYTAVEAVQERVGVAVCTCTNLIPSTNCRKPTLLPRTSTAHSFSTCHRTLAIPVSKVVESQLT